VKQNRTNIHQSEFEPKFTLIPNLKRSKILFYPNRTKPKVVAVKGPSKAIFPENSFGSWESESCEVWVWDWKLARSYIQRLRYPREMSLSLPHHLLSILIGKFSDQAPGDGGVNPEEPNQYWLL